MDGINLFYAAVMLNVAATILLAIGHRSLKGTSPMSEVALFSAVLLWSLTVVIRIGGDVLGLNLNWSGRLVASFFYAGVFHVAFHRLYEWTAPGKRTVTTPTS